MVRILLKRVREYKKYAFITPLFMVGEVAMEVLIPTLMALIIDNGVAYNDMPYIIRVSIMLVVAAMLSLSFGMLGAWSASKASSGFASNIREDEYRKIMSFSFADVDKFSTPSLITRMTTDVQNVQQSFQMLIRICVRSPIMFIFAIIMVYHNGGSLSLVFAIAIPIVIVAIAILFTKTHVAFTNAFRGYDTFNRVVQENLNGIRTVKAYVREESELARFDEASEVIRRNFTKGTSPSVRRLWHSWGLS